MKSNVCLFVFVLKLEEKQKHAIDVLYDLLPERYETTSRRKKLRKLFHEEAAYKAQFYAIWALNSFSVIRNRVMTASVRQKIMSSEYVDPLGFMLDNSAALLKINQNLASVSKSQAQKMTMKDSIHLSTANNNDEEARDVSEFLSSVMSGGARTQDESSEKQPTIGNEFVETIANIFDKFKISTVCLLKIIIFLSS